MGAMSWTVYRRVNDSQLHGLAGRWRNCVPCRVGRSMPRNWLNVGSTFPVSTPCDLGPILMT